MVERDLNWLDRVVDEKAKPQKVPYPSRDDVGIAERFLGDPEATRRLALGIEQVANAVRMMAAGGVKEEVLCFLIQKSIAYGVSSNEVSIKTIRAVLVHAANLDKWALEAAAGEEPEPKKRGRR